MVFGFGDTLAARQVLERAGDRVRPEQRVWHRGLTAELRRDFASAVQSFAAYPASLRTKHALVAVFADRMGDTVTARAHADSLLAIAAPRLESAASRANLRQVAVSRYELAIVHAIHGRHDEAVREAEEGLRLLPFRSHRSAASLARELVWVYMRAGRPDDAVALLRRILAFPGGETHHGLRLNPRYDGLREHPGFQALVADTAPRAAADTGANGSS